MADEFGEGSCFGFWDTKWRPGFHDWLNSDASTDTDARRQMADDHQWHMDLCGRMHQVMLMLGRLTDATKPSA